MSIYLKLLSYDLCPEYKQDMIERITNAHILVRKSHLPSHGSGVLYRFTLLANNDTVFYFITKKLYRFFVF